MRGSFLRLCVKSLHRAWTDCWLRKGLMITAAAKTPGYSNKRTAIFSWLFSSPSFSESLLQKDDGDRARFRSSSTFSDTRALQESQVQRFRNLRFFFHFYVYMHTHASEWIQNCSWKWYEIKWEINQGQDDGNKWNLFFRVFPSWYCFALDNINLLHTQHTGRQSLESVRLNREGTNLSWVLSKHGQNLCVLSPAIPWKCPKQCRLICAKDEDHRNH